MPLNLIPHVWYIAAAIFALAGVVLLIRWLIGDRSRGRRRCPKCWYDMSATNGLTCPECGRTAKHERRMFRSRRRRRTLLVGISALLLAGSVVIAAELNRPSWPSRIPSAVLLVLTKQSPATIHHTLWSRGAVLPPPGISLRPSAAQQPPSAPNVSWRTRLEEEMFLRYHQGRIPAWVHRKYILRDLHTSLSPSAVLKLESSIRPGAPIRLCISDAALSFFQSPASAVRLIIEPLSPPGTSSRFGSAYPYTSNRALGVLPHLDIDTDALTPGNHTLRIRIRLQSVSFDSKPPVVLLDEILDHQIEVSATAPLPVERIDNPEVNAHVPRMLTLTIDPADTTWQSVELSVDHRQLGLYEALVYNVSVDLARDGEILARAHIAPGQSAAPLSPIWTALQKADLLHELLDVEQSQRWTLTVAAASVHLNASCDPIRIWTGSITIPAASRLQHTPQHHPMP